MNILGITKLPLLIRIKRKQLLHVLLIDAYRTMPFGLWNAPATFQRCIMSIFSKYAAYIIVVFMDDFIVYGDSFDQCLENLDLILKKCIESNLLLNYEKCHFMVE